MWKVNRTWHQETTCTCAHAYQESYSSLSLSWHKSVLAQANEHGAKPTVIAIHPCTCIATLF